MDFNKFNKGKRSSRREKLNLIQGTRYIVRPDKRDILIIVTENGEGYNFISGQQVFGELNIVKKIDSTEEHLFQDLRKEYAEQQKMSYKERKFSATGILTSSFKLRL